MYTTKKVMTKQKSKSNSRGRTWRFMFKENDDHCIVIQTKATTKKEGRQKAVDLLKEKGYTGISAKLKDI